jgi:hypothetical protein
VRVLLLQPGGHRRIGHEVQHLIRPVELVSSLGRQLPEELDPGTDDDQ